VKVGIYIDAWKLPIFERHLQQAALAYETAPGISPDTLSLHVDVADHRELQNICTQANQEAAKQGHQP
jgi:hypothetical protein